MKEIIIAYPVKEVALQLRSMIESEGYHVSYICACGATVLNIAQGMHEGVIVCASILSDMGAGVLAENLPVGFDVIALSKNGVESYMGNLISLPLPVNRAEFINTIAILVSSRSGFTRRKDNENEIISNAKTILMNDNDITETQAHKYLQKESMKRGKKMVELAREIINDFKQ